MEKKEEIQLAEGWAFPRNSWQAHYFRNEKSLCRGWWYKGELKTVVWGETCVVCRERAEAFQ